MTELIASITSVFTAAIGWVGTTASTIAAQPILLLACVGVPLCGLGVGLFKRLTNPGVCVRSPHTPVLSF